MKKYEILYVWPISKLESLCDSVETEAFVDSLDEESTEHKNLIRYIDALRAFKSDLIAAKEAKNQYVKWGEIRALLDEVEQHFSAFPNLDSNRTRLSLLLAEKLVVTLPEPSVTGVPDFDEADIDETLFELRALREPLPISWFVRQNAQSFSDSLAVFNTVGVGALENEIAASTMSPELIFQLLGLLHTDQNIPTPQAVLIKRANPSIDGIAVDAFVRLQLLASGAAVHTPKNYLNSPSIVDVDGIRAGTPYQQLDEVFYVMSEYNSRQDFLAKYLSIYHVIENFMFKRPIVELERRRNGQMFSIRDFKRLYQELDVREISALKKLMAIVFEFEPAAGKKFEKIICDRWLAFCPVANVPNLDALLERLGLRRGDAPLRHADFCGDSAYSYFAQIVYAVRNVIVHNTETEWHLSYATLDESAQLLLEGFLLPSLEEICFAFAGSANPHVWYQNKVLSLYQ